ncbi:MAG: hypothetical protein GY769_03760 [bacterium]|nr:hypothetical protein [bacterium]
MSDRILDVFLAVVALAALGLAAALWLQATRSLRRGGALERTLDGALVICWLSVVFFFLLAGLGAFRVWIAAGGMLITGLTAAALAPKSRTPRQVLNGVSLRGPELRDPWLWAALPVAGIALARLIKGMAAPPMAWDAMTMHLPKAAFWIQSGSLALPDFPDAWTYYRWFPAGGEILFAWVMLPFRGDLLLGVFGFAVWLAVGIAGARLARLLGAPNRTAWLGGAALAALPTVLVFMTANYVDNLVVLFILLAITHALMFLRDPAPANGVLGLAALGLAIATKTSSVLLAAPVMLAIAATAWRHRGRLARTVYPSFGAALLLPCVGYVWTWIRTGSPFYPIKAPLLRLPFHQELAELFSGQVFSPAVLTGAGWPGFLRLFWSGAPGEGHMNFGVGGAILGAAALLGVGLSLNRSDRRLPVLLCLAGAVITIPFVLSAGNLALRTVWIGVLGRHILPAFAPIALCATLLPGWSARLALSASLLAATFHFFPIGWSEAMVEPSLQIAGVVVVCALATFALQTFAARTLRARTRVGLLVLTGVLSLSAWDTIRGRARYPIYRETAPGLGAFDAHPIHPTFATAASLWQMLDTPEEKRIGVTVGRDQVGHNQFFYPLLGSRLQNRLMHLPTSTVPNELELSARERYARAEPEAWLAHLEASSVSLVVGLWQPTPESDWLLREGSFEVAALTDLGVPWIGRRRAQQPSVPLP